MADNVESNPNDNPPKEAGKKGIDELQACIEEVQVILEKKFPSDDDDLARVGVAINSCYDVEKTPLPTASEAPVPQNGKPR